MPDGCRVCGWPETTWRGLCKVHELRAAAARITAMLDGTAGYSRPPRGPPWSALLDAREAMNRAADRLASAREGLTV